MRGRKRPGISNRPVDPLGELLVGFQVLLTRGLLGCILYSVDPETQHMLAGLDITQLEETSHITRSAASREAADYDAGVGKTCILVSISADVA